MQSMSAMTFSVKTGLANKAHGTLERHDVLMMSGDGRVIHVVLGCFVLRVAKLVHGCLMTK
jgi:hypothetical protein